MIATDPAKGSSRLCVPLQTRAIAKNLVTLLLLLLPALSAQGQSKRIVSTFPSATETLFALGVGNSVVGVSTYCRYPPSVLSLPKVGTYIKPDPEKIALLRPDLVIIEKTATALADQLSALNIRYAPVKVGALAEVYSMIQDIGLAAGVPGKAESLNQQIKGRLATVRAEGMGHTRPTVLMIVGKTPGLLTNLIAVGSSTYLGELLQIAGGSNALGNIVIPYTHISLETVVRLNPDVILDLSMQAEATEPAIQEDRLRQAWLTHFELAAVRNGNVFGLVSETLVTPGPRVVDAVDEIRTRIQTALKKAER